MFFDKSTIDNNTYKELNNDESEILKIEELYIKRRGELFKISLNILGDYQLAEDVCQIVFVILIENKKYKNLLELTQEERKAYLIVMTRNISINIKKSKVSEEISITDANTDIISMNCNNYSMEQKIIDRMTYDEVMNIMYELPSGYTEVMFAKYCYGYNNRQISKQLNLSECTVRKRIERGIKKVIKIYSGDRKQKN